MKPFYLTRLTKAELLTLVNLATMTEHHAPQLSRWLLGLYYQEQGRRDICDRKPVEPEPVVWPEWTGEALAAAMGQSHNLSHIGFHDKPELAELLRQLHSWLMACARSELRRAK